MIRRMLVVATLAALALTGCASSSDSKGAGPVDAAELIDRLGAEWTLVSIRGGQDIRRDLGTAGVGNLPSLTYDSESGRIAGSGGVNRWSAALDTEALARGGFIAGPAMSTMMAGPEPAMRVEQAFLGALAEVTTLDTGPTADGLLILRDQTGAELLRFKRASE